MTKKEKKIDDAITECYVELYKNSTPPADFKELLSNAEINEQHQRVIDFLAYEIGEEEYNDIVKAIIDKYKFKGYMVQMFKNTISFGCSPKFKDKTTNK